MRVVRSIGYVLVALVYATWLAAFGLLGAWIMRDIVPPWINLTGVAFIFVVTFLYVAIRSIVNDELTLFDD